MKELADEKKDGRQKSIHRNLTTPKRAALTVAGGAHGLAEIRKESLMCIPWKWLSQLMVVVYRRA